MRKYSLVNNVVFTYYLMELLQYAAKSGIDVAVDEVARTWYQQKKYVEDGASDTMNSLHLVRCAADLDVVENGEKVKDGEHPSYEKLGTFWESLNSGCVWGGQWRRKDSRHFQYWQEVA